MLAIENIKKHYGNKKERREILHDINLSISDHEFVCLLGPSGCGKSTLLRLMAGLESASEGSILLNGQAVKEPSRECAFVFQDYALFPWKTVLENVEFGMAANNMYDKRKRRDKAMEYLAMVHLKGVENSYIHQLSGGMKQRTAIARSLALEPKLCFMDEPFGALDNFTRMELQDLLRSMYKEQHMSIVFVTHDIDEAIYLGDRVVIMDANPGRINTVMTLDKAATLERTGENFKSYREKIFNAFHLICQNNKIEYYI
jgi:NitT/TauT family transport system ATP-binding protein